MDVKIRRSTISLENVDRRKLRLENCKLFDRVVFLYQSTHLHI